ncbi:Ubiquinone biosynthesis O-methyltransferase [compost metagenome]
MLGAEYVLNMLPKGTHEYARFLKPSELSRMARNAGLGVETLAGIGYNPLTRVYSLNDDTDVNYLMATRRLA